jgi:hypothetical protein
VGENNKGIEAALATVDLITLYRNMEPVKEISDKHVN